MDKRTIIAFIIIGLIIILWPAYMRWISGGKKQPQTPVQTPTTETQPAEKETVASKGQQADKSGLTPAISDTVTKRILVETEVYKAEFSTRGAELIGFVLKKYHKQKNGPIELVPRTHFLPGLSLYFPDLSLRASDFNFQVDKQKIFLEGKNRTDKLTFKLQTKEGVSITKEFTFFSDRYEIKLNLDISGASLGRKYNLEWLPGLSATEPDLGKDLSYFATSAWMGKEKFDLKNFKDQNLWARSGETWWVATRTKYFMVGFIPLSQKATGFVAQQRSLSDPLEKRISTSIELPLNSPATKDSFWVYLGPIDYHILKTYKVNLEQMVDLGWKIIKPFSIAILWFFTLLHKFIPNYGVVIILFTLIMKVLFHPLSLKMLRTSQKMAELQPKLARLKEKYKNNPQEMNKATWQLYREHKLNPFGGCLPLLLQMPLFYGMFVVFQSTIELRQAKFMFWLEDLSLKDPYYVLPIIMALTMFWQQKMTIKDPRQKMMVYMFPALFFFLFMNFPAGLTLYWTFYNILSVVEQYLIKSKYYTPKTSAITQ